MPSRYRQTNNLFVPDAAYIAGLVDGEGTIALSRRHRNEERQLVKAISNTERSVLEYVPLEPDGSRENGPIVTGTLLG